MSNTVIGACYWLTLVQKIDSPLCLIAPAIYSNDLEITSIVMHAHGNVNTVN